MISGYTFAVDALKSLVLTLAVMDKHISVEKAVQLSRLEQDYQVNSATSYEPRREKTGFSHM